MKISFLKIALAVSLIFNLSVLGAVAYFHYSKNDYWVSPLGVKVKKGQFLFEELSLRPEQAKRMKEKALPFRSEIDKKRQQIEDLRSRLFMLMRADVPDDAAIKATIAEISGIQGTVESMVAAHILQEKATLDKNQQNKFLDLIENNMRKGSQSRCPSVMQSQ